METDVNYAFIAHLAPFDADLDVGDKIYEGGGYFFQTVGRTTFEGVALLALTFNNTSCGMCEDMSWANLPEGVQWTLLAHGTCPSPMAGTCGYCSTHPVVEYWVWDTGIRMPGLGAESYGY